MWHYQSFWPLHPGSSGVLSPMLEKLVAARQKYITAFGFGNHLSAAFGAVGQSHGWWCYSTTAPRSPGPAWMCTLAYHAQVQTLHHFLKILPARNWRHGYDCASVPRTVVHTPQRASRETVQDDAHPFLLLSRMHFELDSSPIPYSTQRLVLSIQGSYPLLHYVHVPPTGSGLRIETRGAVWYTNAAAAARDVDGRAAPWPGHPLVDDERIKEQIGRGLDLVRWFRRSSRTTSNLFGSHIELHVIGTNHRRTLEHRPAPARRPPPATRRPRRSTPAAILLHDKQNISHMKWGVPNSRQTMHNLRDLISVFNLAVALVWIIILAEFDAPQGEVALYLDRKRCYI
ncbi:hypothetical protein B0H16DRAFT_1455299 [Mycena metata]|uniref:Uncharacterized protein n=1 Tax=Mycena metata TaxID=1033252 RepID=A0AAD7JGQ1_9AGAR|nr:hypothetical protein B0H16DRAFT_1455299 [Mycena metata]